MKINFNTSTNFKGYYNGTYYKDCIISYSKKYQYTTNYRDALWDDVFEHEKEDQFNTYFAALNLIQQMQDNNSKKDNQITNLNKSLENAEKQISSANDENKIKQLEIKKLKIENILSEIVVMDCLVEQKRINAVASRLETEIFDKINLENKGIENVIFQNGYMIKGLSANEQQKIYNLLKNKSIPVRIVDFQKCSTPTEAIRAINNAKIELKNNSTHGIILFKNFSKYMTPSEENFDIINTFKNYFQNSARNFNIVNIVFEDHREKLDGAIRSGQRFVEPSIDVSNINKEDILKDYKKSITDILTQIKSTGIRTAKEKTITLKIIDMINKKLSSINTDELRKMCMGEFYYISGNGLRYYYADDFDEDDDNSVFLYLGDFGRDDSILWIDSSDDEKINTVLERLDIIKQQNLFKHVNKIQCPQPNNNIPNGFYKVYWHRTADDKTIYEKNI